MRNMLNIFVLAECYDILGQRNQIVVFRKLLLELLKTYLNAFCMLYQSLGLAQESSAYASWIILGLPDCH